MSTSIDVNAPPVPIRTSSRSGKHWIDEWDPEDQAFWESTGKAMRRASATSRVPGLAGARI